MMLVLLRIGIGSHFLYQGIWKYRNPSFTSEAFLLQAKGPLADKFYEMVPDQDGRQRLALPEPSRTSPDDHAASSEAEASQYETNLAAFDQYLTKFDRQYGLTNEQLAEAKKISSRFRDQQAAFLAENHEDIENYFHELERLAAMKSNPAKDAPYLQKRIWDKQQELRAQAAGWLRWLEGNWRLYEETLAMELSEAQKERGPVKTPMTSLERIDLLVMGTNVAVGVCLIAGLFTRLACVGGGLFLLSIVAAQPDWPGLYPPPHPSAGRSLLINKEFIEMLAMFTLATTHVGRWGGLDFWVHNLFTRKTS